MRIHTLNPPSGSEVMAHAKSSLMRFILHDQSNSRVVGFANTYWTADSLKPATLLARIEKVRFCHPGYIAHALTVRWSTLTLHK